MRRLLTGIVLLVMLSQVPQVSEYFKEEKQGVDAAYEKATKVYSAASNIYDKTKEEIDSVQGSLDKTNEDLSQGDDYAEQAGIEASKFYNTFKSLVSDIKGAINTSASEDKEVAEDKS